MNFESKKSDEEAVDHLLAALGQSAAPEGMEGRILRRLATAPVPARKRVWPWLGVALVPAILMLAAFLHPWVSHVSWKQATTIATADSSAALRNDNKGATAAGAANTAGVPHVSLLRHGFTNSRGGAESRVVSQGGESSVESSRLVSEALLNHPAPALPLTEQEKLLLRVARRNDPEQMAGLVPANRELETLLDHAEYETFFAAPPPLDQPATQPAQVNEDWHPAR